MPSIAQMVNATRLRLREPRTQVPSYRTVLQAVMSHTQSMYSQIENSGQKWAVQDYSLKVTPNTRDYQLAVDSSFGKPFLVLTYYPQNQSYIERPIALYELGDMNFNWGLPYNAAAWMANWDGSPNTAMRMGFYRKHGDQCWVRIMPTPMLSAEYLLMYGIGDYSSYAGLDSQPVLSQHHQYIEVCAALSLLPHCEWWDDELMNQNRRKELALSLSMDKQTFGDDWQRYVRDIVDDQLTTIVGASGVGQGWMY